MAKALVLYNPPKDPAAFDDYYARVHIPLARKIPGVRSYEISRGPVNPSPGMSPFHLVAILTFDSMADLQAGLGSPEGKAALEDLPNFATGGVSTLVFEHAPAA